MEFSMRLHRTPDDSILAICDAAILGKTFRQGNICLEVSEPFYGGDIVSEEEVVNAMGRFSIINMVGNEIVDLAISKGIVFAENIIVVDGVKHAQAVRM